jgi:uncharacterized protein
MNLNTKYENLIDIIRDLKSVALGFSGGVDSTFLAKVCQDVLGDKAIVVTATSSIFSNREFKESKELANNIGIKQIVIEIKENQIDAFAKNPPNRCYYCKHEIFSTVKKVAMEYGINQVIDGSNFDDIGDYRPGMQAAKELGIVSPLKAAKLTKEDIRVLSKRLGLPTWEKPSFACLASRFPYGEEITTEKLSMVERAEEYLRSNGFKQYRVRHHGKMARIEIEVSEMPKFLNLDFDIISKQFKVIGFTYVTLDLTGYRLGSMNEVLK